MKSPKKSPAVPLHRRVNWDEAPQPGKQLRKRIDHIDAKLRPLRARGNVGELPSAEDFAAELGVTAQTIYRTVERMQDDYAMPVEYVPARHGYLYTEDVLSTPFCKFSEGEVLAVYLSHEMMSAFHEIAAEEEGAVGLSEGDRADGR